MAARKVVPVILRGPLRGRLRMTDQGRLALRFPRAKKIPPPPRSLESNSHVAGQNGSNSPLQVRCLLLAY